MSSPAPTFPSIFAYYFPGLPSTKRPGNMIDGGASGRGTGVRKMQAHLLAPSSRNPLVPLSPQKPKGTNGCLSAAKPESSKWPQLGTSPLRPVAYAPSTRDCSRSSWGETPYWNESTFKLATRDHCIPESSIGQRDQVDRRNWSVGSNQIKHLRPGERKGTV